MRKQCERGFAVALAVVVSIGLLPAPVMAAGVESEAYVSVSTQSFDDGETWEESDWDDEHIIASDKDKDSDDPEDDNRREAENGHGDKDDCEEREEDHEEKDTHEESGHDHTEKDSHEEKEHDHEEEEPHEESDHDHGDGEKDTHKEHEDDHEEEDTHGEGEHDHEEEDEHREKKHDHEEDEHDHEEEDEHREKKHDHEEGEHDHEEEDEHREKKHDHEEKEDSHWDLNNDERWQKDDDIILSKEKQHADWGKRIEAPEYARDLYGILSVGTESGDVLGSLVQDSSFTLPSASSAVVSQDLVQIECVRFDLADLFAGEDSLANLFAGENSSLGVSVFEEEDFYQVDATLGDKQVDYASLQPGDVVRTEAFNGIFITSLPKGADYDEEKKVACSNISMVYQAFDRDFPEVFWLSGKCRIRIPVVRAADGTEWAYFFLVLTDSEGFTMRAPDWTADGAVADGIQRREEAVERILGTVTAENPMEIVRQLNRWLTEHNEYNTTSDLTAIGNEPHECLSALEGRAGSDGPVCDGYSRAFKVLCDRLNIPCILENGYAKASPDSEGIFHMWNAVKIGSDWYGADITWNDPIVEGVSQAKSGWENEQYLLVGSTTVIRGMAFADSHPATNQASHDGVAFDNGPLLCDVAYTVPFAGITKRTVHRQDTLFVADKSDIKYIFQWFFTRRTHDMPMNLANYILFGQWMIP